MITACHEHETKKGGRGQSTTTTNNYVKFSSNVSLNSWKIHVHLNHLQISFYRQNFTGKQTSNTILFSPNVILGSVAQCICLATRQSVKKTATRTDPFCLILFIFHTDFLFPIGFFPFVLLLALTLCFSRLCDSRILVFKPGAKHSRRPRARGPRSSIEIHSFFYIRMLFFRPRLNILIFLPILGWKYSCIILKL